MGRMKVVLLTPYHRVLRWRAGSQALRLAARNVNAPVTWAKGTQTAGGRGAAGTQQFPAPSPKLHPELCGPRRTGNQTRGDTEAAEASSGRGCPRASPRGPLGSPEDSHGCDFSDRPSGMSQSVMRIRVPESPREGLPPLRPSASLFLANQSHAASGCQATPTWPWQVTPRLRRDSAPPPDPGPQPQLRFRISPEPCPCGDPASSYPREPGQVTQESSSVLPWVRGGGRGAFHTHTHPAPSQHGNQRTVTHPGRVENLHPAHQPVKKNSGPGW